MCVSFCAVRSKFDETGFDVDRARLDADFPEFSFASFGEFASNQDWDAVPGGAGR